MRRPLDRVRIGAIVLGAIVALSTLGYRLAGWSWIDSLYMVVITIGTVGYGETRPMGDLMRVYTMFVIVFGISAGAYTFGGLIQLMAEGELNRVFSEHRMSRGIEQLKDHLIVCGFGRMGQILAEEMVRKKASYVVIDSDSTRTEQARAQGYLALTGDATEEDVLLNAGVERANSLVTALPNDAANVFITLTSRNLNPKLQIIARGEFPTTQKKLLQAGADRVVLPAVIGAHRIAAMLTRPSTLELMEIFAGKSTVDVEIDEWTIPANSTLVGRTVAEAETRRRHGLLVVAVKHAHGKMTFNPEASFAFSAGDIIIVMGRPTDIERFRHDFEVQ